MKVCTLIAIAVIFIYVSTARPVDIKLPNVGTVLFSTKDLHKKFWPKTDVALLEARRHLQHLIPPPVLVNPSYNFVDILIDYFKQSYISIKNTASNPEENSILTTALSDIIGGYLKLWIIPTTKFAYYSGAITQEQAFRVFSFYDEIRKYLQTDGSGWSNPDNKMLKTIVLNIPQTISLKVPQTHIRSTNVDPCELFAYFEKTPDGFTIPLPSINWDQNTMFVPLKNQSLVHLSSSEYSNMLVNYYTAAKSCLQRRSPNITNEFDEKLQSWLFQTVLPHLSDDHLYVALGNVMMLFNDTETLNSKFPWENQNLALSEPKPGMMKSYLICQMDSYSKYIWNKIKCMFACIWRYKMITISCLLLFAVLWCMFAMNRLDIKIKEKPFCFCKKVSIFFSERGCKMPKNGSYYTPDEDTKDLKHLKPKQKKGKPKETISNETSKRVKQEDTSNKVSKSSSSSKKARKNKEDKLDKTTPPLKSLSHMKCEEKRKPSPVFDTTPPSKSLSHIKCEEKRKPSPGFDKSTSDAINTKAAADTTSTNTSQEPTLQKSTPYSSSSEKCCSNPCSITESELDKILYCPHCSNSASNQIVTSESDKSNTDQSPSCSCQSKSDESTQNEDKSDKFTDIKDKNKVGHMRALDVKYSDQKPPSGIKLNVIPKSRRRIEESDTLLSKQHTHVAYSTVTSGSRPCVSSVYEIMKEVSSRSKKLLSESNSSQRIPSKKSTKSDMSENLRISQDSENVVTLFRKRSMSGSVFSTIQNEPPLKNSLSKCVSIKTPFDTLHESASSLISDYYAHQTKKNISHMSNTERKTLDDTIMTSSTFVDDLNKPERETQLQTHKSSKMDTERKTEEHSLKEGKSKRAIKSNSITYDVTAFRVDEPVREPKLERTSSRHLRKNFRKGEEKIMKCKDTEGETKELRREESKELRSEHREKKHVHETHPRHRIKEPNGTDCNFEVTKKSPAVSEEEIAKKHDLLRSITKKEVSKEYDVEEQQKIQDGSKDSTRELAKRKMVLAVTSQRESRKSTRDSYLEIKIDRPKTEISVGVTGSMVGRIEKSRILRQSKRVMPSTDKTEERVQRVVRESRIPKRATPGSHDQSPEPESRLPQNLTAKTKSKIPQPKKRALDDIVIKTKEPSSRLNVTL